MALEFAFIAPLMLLLTVGFFELIFLLSDMHTASEATRRGARIAIVQSPIADLSELPGGAGITCTRASSAVSCTGGSVIAEATFDAILAAMQQIAPWLTEQNVQVSYAQSGLDSGSQLITPLVTVRVIDATYQLKSGDAFPSLGLDVAMPSFSTSRLGPTYVLN
jgi:Flp pilus assembly protein TadG